MIKSKETENKITGLKTWDMYFKCDKCGQFISNGTMRWFNQFSKINQYCTKHINIKQK